MRNKKKETRSAGRKGMGLGRPGIRGEYGSETPVSKRVVNFLFAGTVLAGSLFSVPASAAGLTDTQSANYNDLAGTDSTAGYGDLHGSDRGKRGSSGDFSPPAADANGNYPSLATYVGKLFCTACGRHCALTAPQCGIGVSQYQEAVALYESTVATSSASAAEESTSRSGPSAAVQERTTEQSGTAISGQSVSEAQSSTSGGSQGNKNSGTSASGSSQSDTNSQALQEFLSGLICTGCGRHCPLTALQCARGNVYLEEAKAEFAAQQGSTSEDQSGNSSESQTADESDLLGDVMEYAPFGGLMVGGVYYTIALLKKKKSSDDSQHDSWR